MSLARDGRCDSPGSSAKYCTYSLLDIDTDTIIYMETLDKREVALQSPNMEKEAVVQSIKHLHDNHNIIIRELVTDGSSSVRKMLGKLYCTVGIITSYYIIATDHPTIHHSMDIWHKAKKTKKGTY